MSNQLIIALYVDLPRTVRKKRTEAMVTMLVLKSMNLNSAVNLNPESNELLVIPNAILKMMQAMQRVNEYRTRFLFVLTSLEYSRVPNTK